MITNKPDNNEPLTPEEFAVMEAAEWEVTSVYTFKGHGVERLVEDAADDLVEGREASKL